MPRTAYSKTPLSAPCRQSFQLPIRLLFISVILTCLTHISAVAEGGQQTISLSVTNAPLEKVFKEIQKQSGYTFVYTRELLQQTKPVTLRLSNARVDEAITQVLKDQPLTFVLVDRMIILKVKSPAI